MSLRSYWLASGTFLFLLFFAVIGHASSQQMAFIGRNINAITYINTNSDCTRLVFGSSMGQTWPQPAIQYFPGDNGKTILVCDFAQIYWNRIEQVIVPQNSEIEKIHIGQLQISPPIFRLSFTSAKRASLTKIDLTATQGQLIVTLPEKSFRAQALKMPAKQNPKPTIVNKVDKLPPVAPIPEAVSKPVVPVKPTPMAKPVIAEPVPPPKAASKAPSLASDVTIIPVDEKGNEIAPAKSSAKEKVKAKTEEKKTTTLSEMPPLAPPISNLIKPADFAQVESKPEPKAELPTKNSSNDNNFNVSLSYKPFKITVLSKTPLQIQTLILSEPDRYVIDFPNNNFGTTMPDIPVNENPYIKSIRFGNVDNAARMVLDLKSQEIDVSTDYNENKTSLSIAFAGTNLPMPKGHLPKNCSIVLDAGHGGSDPGAQRGSIQEKDLTFGIASKTKKALEKNGIKVTMTRSDDTFVSLQDRVQITNSLSPNLFLSIHINSLETNTNTYGIETYYFNDVSKTLAKDIHASLVNNLSAPDRSVRKARFYVINHTPHPAVLAEVGFISNKDERDKLITQDYQEQIAQALTEGVIRFLIEANNPKEK